MALIHYAILELGFHCMPILWLATKSIVQDVTRENWMSGWMQTKDSIQMDQSVQLRWRGSGWSNRGHFITLPMKILLTSSMFMALCLKSMQEDRMQEQFYSMAIIHWLTKALCFISPIHITTITLWISTARHLPFIWLPTNSKRMWKEVPWINGRMINSVKFLGALIWLENLTILCARMEVTLPFLQT